eukprot:scaffold6568_cov144-Cylindrotheca_fusiformis.AAC.2
MDSPASWLLRLLPKIIVDSIRIDENSTLPYDARTRQRTWHKWMLARQVCEYQQRKRHKRMLARQAIQPLCIKRHLRGSWSATLSFLLARNKLDDSIDVKKRIQKATGAFAAMANMLKDRKISTKLKLRSYEATMPRSRVKYHMFNVREKTDSQRENQRNDGQLSCNRPNNGNQKVEMAGETSSDARDSKPQKRLHIMDPTAKTNRKDHAKRSAKHMCIL